MSNTFKEMKRMISEDMELAYEGEISIISEDQAHITLWDYYNDDLDRTYTLTDPDKIDAGYVKERIITTNSACNLADINTDLLCEYLCQNAKNTLISLDSIIFVNDTEEDFDELYRRMDDHDWSEILEVNDLPVDTLGIMWFERSMVVVNLGAILETVKEMVVNGEIDPEDFQSEFNIGVVTTLLHELRHLEQANPYIPAEDFNQIDLDMETDAEEYARDCYDHHPIDIVNSLEYEYDNEKEKENR